MCEGRELRLEEEGGGGWGEDVEGGGQRAGGNCVTDV